MKRLCPETTICVPPPKPGKPMNPPGPPPGPPKRRVAGGGVPASSAGGGSSCAVAYFPIPRPAADSQTAAITNLDFLFIRFPLIGRGKDPKLFSEPVTDSSHGLWKR